MSSTLFIKENVRDSDLTFINKTPRDTNLPEKVSHNLEKESRGTRG